jgi:putative transposase
MVLWPEHDGDLAAFMQRLTTTHVRRWHLHRKTVGCGHLYQGTYKSFPIEADEHLLTVLAYVGGKKGISPILTDRGGYDRFQRCHEQHA